MAEVIYKGKPVAVKAGQTVLSALLTQGHEIPNSCQAGVCQSCMMQAIEGDIPAEAQVGVKDTLKAQGYFLACSCKPETSLKLVLADQTMTRHEAFVVDKKLLSANVLRLRLKTKLPFLYHAGQYVTIWNNENAGRSYSLASVPGLEDFLEFHIRRFPDGKFSNWLHDDVQRNDIIQIQSAVGDCFYVPGLAEQKLLLAGVGTGLAPLWGIARDALQHGHVGDIHLIHGALNASELYLHDQLLQMAESHKNFFYYASILEGDEVGLPIRKSSIDEVIMDVAPEPADWKAYLCGDPEIVNQLKKNLFLAGASMRHIYADPFIAAPHNTETK